MASRFQVKGLALCPHHAPASPSRARWALPLMHEPLKGNNTVVATPRDHVVLECRLR